VHNLIEGMRWRVRQFARMRLSGLARKIDAFDRLEDRQLLLNVIFPYLLAEGGIRRILFIGCEWYTKHYAAMLRSKEYWTLEADAEKRKYGAQRHIVDSLRNLPRHVAGDYFDAIICNGVFMVTAIETREEAEPSFEACRACLRKGGLFVLGWNDTAALRPYPPEESDALARFERFVFPPLATDRHLTNTGYRHVYSFFVRP
jgi:SAM-dependent methyltransferase